MKLIEALNIIAEAGRQAEAAPEQQHPERRYALACGFEPLHLRTFLTAFLQLRSRTGWRAGVTTGLYGDLAGNLRRAREPGVAACAAVVEWPDLDPRLGFRSLAGWDPSSLPDIVATVESALKRLAEELSQVAARCPVALCLPTLPPAPVALAEPWRAGTLELELAAKVAAFAAGLAPVAAIRVVGSALDSASPKAQRHDLRAELAKGFPYSQSHAAAVAQALAGLLEPAPVRKGIVTDLDNTLWSGILGEVGVDGVAWDLASHAQVHGLYQQILAALAARGVLLAVASKNDPALVHQAFQRRGPDLRIAESRIYPFAAHWGPKSESVKTILAAWNIAADDVVFIDDSAMELAEVKSAHPAIECLEFSADPAAFPRMVEDLRRWFGKSAAVSGEDGLRGESIRAGAAWREASAGANESFEVFLSEAKATVTVELSRRPGGGGGGSSAGRALELVNKTNQFNLNGRRYSDAEWTAYLERPEVVLATAAYTDRFGPLGVIAVALGRVEEQGKVLRLDTWVMSCRAFSRRIEHQFLRALFDLLEVEEMVFDYLETPRNEPTRTFLAGFVAVPESGARLAASGFGRQCPTLYHTLETKLS